MRFYKEAQKELYGREVMVFDEGFICYDPKTEDGGIYVQLLFVSKEFRNKKNAQNILIKTCEHEGASYVTGYIDLTASNYKETLLKHLHCGYDILKGNDSSLIVYCTLDNLKKVYNNG